MSLHTRFQAVCGILLASGVCLGLTGCGNVSNLSEFNDLADIDNLVANNSCHGVVNGKCMDNHGVEDSKSKDVKIISSIAAGQTFEHEGPVKITGDVGANAVVKIKDGIVTVEGSVGNNARIKAEGVDANAGGFFQFGSVTIGSSTIIKETHNGKTVTRTVTSSGNSAGIVVKGKTGDNVTYVADYSVSIQDAGSNLAVKAGHAFNGSNIGRQAIIDVGHSIDLANVESESRLDAGHSIDVGTLGPGSNANAGHSIHADYIAKNASAYSEHSLHADKVHATATTSADYEEHISQIVGRASVNHQGPRSRFNF